jgi:UDP-N-acetyl-D-mannosaminuronic acid dehydrogenase
LYGAFVTGDLVAASSPRAAEMAKLTENSFRDVNIAFANELSVICDRLDIDVWELIGLANRHPRVKVLQPGPGVGGHCIAVDPWFIVASAPEEAQLIRTAREVNDAKPHWVLSKIHAAIKELLNDPRPKSVNDITIACYGIAFKPNIDDLRDSPALEIAAKLAATHTGKVIVVEPNIDALPARLQGIELVPQQVAYSTADLHILLVDHLPFKQGGPPLQGTIIDTRGIWSVSNKPRPPFSK